MKGKWLMSTRGLLCVAAVATVWAALSGCSDKLETGYEPRKLGVSSAERRGYYAAPFTPEAAAAAQGKAEDLRAISNRPGNAGYR